MKRLTVLLILLAACSGTTGPTRSPGPPLIVGGWTVVQAVAYDTVVADGAAGDWTFRTDGFLEAELWIEWQSGQGWGGGAFVTSRYTVQGDTLTVGSQWRIVALTQTGLVLSTDWLPAPAGSPSFPLELSLVRR